MSTQQRTISHTGDTLEDAGYDAVTRSQNQVSPQRDSAILSLTCPENFDEFEYVGQRDAVNFVPRCKETFSGDGSTTTFDVSADLIPIAGEDELVDQPYDVVIATVGGSKVSIASIDYSANTVTLDSAPASGTDNVALFPVISEGVLKFRGRNTLGQVKGPLYPWPHPVYRWADVDQHKRGTEVNLPWPRLLVERNDTLDVMLDSPRQIVWEDADFPESYVSSFQLDVEITF